MFTAIVPTHESIGCRRIGDAIARFAPSNVSVVSRPLSLSMTRTHMTDEVSGDIVILLVNSFVDRYNRLAQRLLDRGQRYAVVQIALRTTPVPDVLHPSWHRLWSRATCVWSYYNLNQWILDAGGETSMCLQNFYHAPLGADPSIFRKTNDGERPYLICTTGRKLMQEGVYECDGAARRVGGRVFHLGPEFRGMRAVAQRDHDISDEMLALRYNDCQFVSGLRRHEGFELPAAEGLLCGARPILYDQPHYRDWYHPWGEFITESDDRGATRRQLEAVFRRGVRPLTEDELRAATARFNWQTLVAEFWRRILSA